MNQLRDRFINFLNSRPYLVATLACLITSLMIFAQPGYRIFKKFRSEALLQESIQLVEEESYVQAFYKARTAILLNGSNIDAARHLADLALKFNHSQAHRLWETVINNEEAEASDWAFAVDAAFQKGDYPIAFGYLLRWENEGVDDPSSFALRQAQAYALAGDLDIARDLANQAIDKYPDDQGIHQLHLYLANLLSNEEQRDALAQSLIRPANASFDDLRWVATNNLINSERRIAAIQKILSGADLSLAQRLSFINLGAKLGWIEANDRINQIQVSIDLSDTEQLASFTSALCLLGRYADVLELIEEETAGEHRILMRNLLLAQVREGGVETALDITSQHRGKRLTTLAEETLLRALAFQESGNQGLYQNNLDQAISSANFEDLSFLEYQFQQLGEVGALLDLYERVSQHPTFGTQARSFWLNLAIAVQSESEIAYAINHDPEWVEQLLDPQQKANAIYYSLLYATDPNKARYQAEKLAATFRGNPDFQLLVALAYHRQGMPQVAQQFIANLDVPFENLGPRSRFIAAALTKVPLELPTESLLPAEKGMLQ
ncbi:hypothetical protein [Pelagicoccus sp. SDUM812002]|uniref:hypothetical protein n=1 Tax=Pelagicoccus sp. SDUM812002 TaxID=3041266 RepID=UPI00280F2541|nr:hypothetical protein [Pelagicoccus sp. SDUM812002]MDQ8188185.1 hypothetical protein [Pelagicoccus sp. SDUM812002]